MTKMVLRMIGAVLVLTGTSVGGTTAPGVRVVSQSNSSTVIEFTAPEAEVNPLQVGDRSFSSVTLRGCDANVNEVGKPQLPMVAVLLAMPKGATASVSVVRTEIETLRVTCVEPVQPESQRENLAAVPVVNAACYAQDANYPGTLVRVDKPAVWRDLQVLSVKLFPVQVNSAREELLIYRRMVIRVSYSGGVFPRSVARTMIPMYARAIANFGNLALQPADESDDRVKYLVFRHSNYAQNEWLNDSLIGWAQRRGYRTRVITADGLSADSIKAYINAEYGAPGTEHSLRFVLLVGDANEVATKTDYRDTTYWPAGHVVHLSDHWYGEIMRYVPSPGETLGVDNFPEIAVARLVPSDTQLLTQQVQKIVKYEKRPISGNGWLQKMLMVGWGQSHQFKFGAHLWRHIDVPDTQIPGQFYGFYDPVRKRLYGYRPDEDPSTWPLYHTNDSVRAAIEAGTGMVCYAGHGWSDRWNEWNCLDPHESWTTTNVMNLGNVDLTPVVFNVACSTSHFDQAALCLCEAWMQKWPGGAVATYGATQNSHDGPNRMQCTTLVRALCDTMRWQGPLAWYDAPVCLLGDVDMTMDAKSAGYFTTDTNSMNILMYMLMGDPAMPIWTGGLPCAANVGYPAVIQCGPCSVTVQVN